MPSLLRPTLSAFALALFLSAFLLFWIQPMFAKMVLPLLGGSPFVWNACVVFFQVTLLAGYLYAHLSTTWLGARAQSALHLTLLVLGFLALPIALPPGRMPPVESNPIPWLLGLLLPALGLPFFVLSATAPLMQKWFAQTGDPAGRDPYFLYAASNLGSLSALASYPALIEAHLALTEQGRLWAAGYRCLAAMALLCACLLLRPASRGRTQPQPAQLPPGNGSHRTGALPRARWVLLSFIPSSLMLGTTEWLNNDMAGGPLLWTIPLALYLLSFFLVFQQASPVPHAFCLRLLPLAVLPLTVLIISGATTPIWLLLATHLLVFFVMAMACHGELARSRPPARSLTEFYLWAAAGGALGGMFNTLFAPIAFPALLEYPLAIILACLAWPGMAAQPPKASPADGAYALGVAGLTACLAWAIRTSLVEPGSELGRILMFVLYVVPTLLCLSSAGRPLRFALSLSAFLLCGLGFPVGGETVLHRERSFFGIHRVTLDAQGGYHQLFHGTTLHGQQSLEPSRRREPLAYYHPSGPIGQVFAELVPRISPSEIAVIGLGAGSLAGYAASGQRWTFYEIDPAVERIAADPRYFTFLRDCKAPTQVVLGDARLSLARAQAKRYGLIVVDAFSSDAVPVHLVTREALRLYLERLSEGGLLAFHLSSRSVDLLPVLGDLAGAEGLVCLARQDLTLSPGQRRGGKAPSTWAVMARRAPELGALASDPRWEAVARRPGARLWSDDFSSLLGVIRWN